MTIEITEDQRRQLAGNSRDPYPQHADGLYAAHGTDQKLADFYHARLQVTELLVPLLLCRRHLRIKTTRKISTCAPSLFSFSGRMLKVRNYLGAR
jgi:hypothetical protein